MFQTTAKSKRSSDSGSLSSHNAASIAHHFRVELADHPYLTYFALYSLYLTHTRKRRWSKRWGVYIPITRTKPHRANLVWSRCVATFIFCGVCVSSPFVYELTSLPSLLCKLATLAVLERGFRGTAKKGKQSCAVVHWRLQRRRRRRRRRSGVRVG